MGLGRGLFVVAAVIGVGCGSSDSGGTASSAASSGSGSSSGSGGTLGGSGSASGLLTGSGGSVGDDVIGDGVFASADCGGTRVDALCGPADVTAFLEPQYFFFQCLAADSRVEIWVWDHVVGDLSGTRSRVTFLCPATSLLSPFALPAEDHPGAMVVLEVEPEVSVKGEFDFEEAGVHGWFNVRGE